MKDERNRDKHFSDLNDRRQPAEKSRWNSVVSEVSQKPQYRYFRLNLANGARVNSLMQRTGQSCIELASELLPEAEKELAAFVHAVQELFGSEQARQSVEDWMEELKSMDLPKGHTGPVWRRVTIASAIRLANRVNAPWLIETSEFPNLAVVTALVGCDKVT